MSIDNVMGQSIFNDSSHWKNFNRQGEKPFFRAKANWDNQWKLGRDTIMLKYNYSHYRDHGAVLYQRWALNNEVNFLLIGYYPNGIVHNIDFYLNDLPWETMSLSDTAGTTHDPGTLKEGNGTKSFMSYTGRSLGFETLKNGHEDGEYLHLDVNSNTGISGLVKYHPACINYEPAFEVKFVLNKDTILEILDTTFYSQILIKQKGVKIISVRPDSLKEEAPQYDILTEYFRETENVPVGKWRYFNSETNKTLVEIDFDDCGNEMTRTYFNDDNTIRDKIIYSTTTKTRRIRKRHS
jgi:hypothetical protein